MNRAPDFTKTSMQVEREMSQLIDSVKRSLDSSSGDSEKKGQLVLSAFLSLVVFAAVLGFDYFVGYQSNNEAQLTTSEPVNPSPVVDRRSIDFAATHVDRISRQTTSIQEVKNRVAPAMPIDSQIESIQNSVEDTRRVLAIDAAAAGRPE